MTHPLPAPASSADAAFDALVRREYPRLTELAFALLGNRADAEEIVQDVLFGVWQQRHRFDFGSPVPYLVRAVRNRAISRRRQRALEAHWTRAEPAEPHVSAAPPADARVQGNDLLRALDAAVDALPARSREVFVLQRVNGLSYGEIAATLGISTKTVENVMGRVLLKLRKALKGHLTLQVLLALASRFFSR